MILPSGAAGVAVAGWGHSWEGQDMGKIVLGRVVIGGIVAGVIIDIFEFVLNGWYLAGQWTSVMASLNRAPIGTNAIIAFNIVGLFTGVAAVWTYAAIRPRFGI